MGRLGCQCRDHSRTQRAAIARNAVDVLGRAPTRSPACCYSPRHVSTASRGLRRRKGKGAKDYYTWLEANYSKDFYVGESRASGERQGLEFEASVAVYVSRPHYANVLEAMLADPQHRNFLETPARPRRAFRGGKRALLVPNFAQSRRIRTSRKSFSSSYAGSS
jgi:hypothetical protein